MLSKLRMWLALRLMPKAPITATSVALMKQAETLSCWNCGERIYPSFDSSFNEATTSKEGE